MRLTSELVAPMLKQFSSVFECSMNITDEDGHILASTEPHRINTTMAEVSETQRTGVEKILQLAHTNATQVILPIELYNRILGTLSIECNGGVDFVLPIAKVIKMNVQMSLDQLNMNQKLQYHKKAEEAWLFELISPNGYDPAEMEAIAENIQINCSLKRTVMLIQIHELHAIKDAFRQGELKRRITEGLSPLLPLNGLTTFCGDRQLMLCLPMVGEEVTMERLFAERLMRFLDKAGYTVCIGIGERQEGISGYRESYFQAQQSIQLLHRLLKGKGISHINDWGIIRLMDSIPDKIRQRFANHYEAFVNHLSAEQEETLEAFLESDLNVKEAAERLHLHRNTLLYRLDKLNDQMKLDPKRFNDAIIYKLLLICKRLNT